MDELRTMEKEEKMGKQIQDLQVITTRHCQTASAGK